MNSDPHKSAAEIFLKASELPHEERDAYLHHACQGDPWLAEAVKRLLGNEGAPLPPSPPSD